MKNISLSLLVIAVSLFTGCIPTPTADTTSIQTEELPVVPEATLEPTVSPNISDEQAIRAALADHFGIDGDSFSHFEIKENTGVYARGGVDNGYFLMVKVDGQWAFVDGGHAVPDCNAVAQYGFPTAMVPECNSPIGSPAGTDADAIRAALGAHLGKDGSTLSVIVEQNTGSHARGGVDNGYFLAVKVGDVWVIAANGQAIPDCNAIAQYGFPASMVPECPSGGSNIPDCPGVGLLEATFIKDVTYPDGSQILPGQSFTKTWRLKNVGTCTWNADYQLVFDSGIAMSGPASKQLAGVHIPPGGTMDVSIDLIAPASPGIYRSNWKLRAPNGDIFGLTNGNPIWVEVEVKVSGNSIRAALAEHLGVNEYSLSVSVLQDTGTHARGGVDNGYFLAAKVDGEWVIVADGQAMPDCNAVTQYGFPSYMVPECPLTKIRFKSGGTSAFIKKSIKTGAVQSFTVQASAGQTMVISVASPQNDVFVGVKGVKGGQQLLLNSTRLTSWSGTLPQSQEYEITLTTENSDTYYFLEVEIPLTVHFDPGTYSTILNGHIEVFEEFHPAVQTHVTYLVHASAGQVMDVEISSPNIDSLSLGVFGQDDGQPYQRSQVKNNGFYGVLPISQGYYLSVFSNGSSTDFTLEITII